MRDDEALGAEFEEHRHRLWTVAYRMLGSTADAEDAVQETWLRFTGVERSTIENAPGWLTTVLSRICLNLLRRRATRGEVRVDDTTDVATAPGVDEQLELAETLGLAFLVVLDELSPAERIAFVLHDVFAVPFDEIATIVERSPAAARQLASRARRRVLDAPTPRQDDDVSRAIVDAFLAASRGGDLDELVRLLDPEAVVTSEHAAVDAGAPTLVEGAPAVASMFSGRAQGARRATIDGRPGAVWSQGREVRVVFDFTVVDDRIVRIHLVADRAHLDVLHLEVLGRATG